MSIKLNVLQMFHRNNTSVSSCFFSQDLEQMTLLDCCS